MPFVLALACTAYDAGLLTTTGWCGDGELQRGEACDVNIAAGAAGACPQSCTSKNPCAPKQRVGQECDTRCEPVPITKAKDGDGCCLGDLDSDEDSDCGFCGDGVIDRGERCDPIESCPLPESCTPADACQNVSYLGDPSSCTARCVASPVEACSSGDGCCPAGCNPNTDQDCSEQCGDGEVDRRAGETCEPGSEDIACPETCDDRDPCTRDLTSGSAENCNLACTHTPITEAVPGDGCCATGDAIDQDCEAACSGDDTSCTTVAKDEQDASTRCQALLAQSSGAQSDACNACACRECAEDMLGCYSSDDPKRDQRCIPIVECSAASDCWGDNCYCGWGIGCISPDGPCRQELEAAAVTPSPAAVEQCATDPACAAYRSNRYRDCLRQKCDSACD
jgi:hypothetical protein